MGDSGFVPASKASKSTPLYTEVLGLPVTKIVFSLKCAGFAKTAGDVRDKMFRCIALGQCNGSDA